MLLSLQQRSEREGFTGHHWFSPSLHKVGTAGSSGFLEADLIPIALFAQHCGKRISLKDRTRENNKIHSKLLLAVKLKSLRLLLLKGFA